MKPCVLPQDIWMKYRKGRKLQIWIVCLRSYKQDNRLSILLIRFDWLIRFASTVWLQITQVQSHCHSLFVLFVLSFIYLTVSARWQRHWLHLCVELHCGSCEAFPAKKWKKLVEEKKVEKGWCSACNFSSWIAYFKTDEHHNLSTKNQQIFPSS